MKTSEMVQRIETLMDNMSIGDFTRMYNMIFDTDVKIEDVEVG
jgi:hypothetical protein